VIVLTFRVNGTARTVTLDDPDEPLLYVLRNDLGGQSGA
jgi:aerobic-type carbon monoxide dehydrogenase small subunit (CoxS/CutS family)